MRRGTCATLAMLLLSGFSCPDDQTVTALVIVPMGAHHYSEQDVNGIATLEREVFVTGDTASPLIIGRAGRANVPLNRPSLRLASSNPSVATVSDAGVITALAVGEARILATYESVSDTIRVAVVPRAAELRVVLDPSTIRVGFTSTVRATAYDASGIPFPRTYFDISVDLPAVADGRAGRFMVTGTGPGTASVTSRLAGQDFQARTALTVTP